MQIKILDAGVEFFRRPFITPLQLSSGPISEITEARAAVTVRVNGQTATGRGAIYLSDLWAWPDPAKSHTERDAVMRGLCERIADDLNALCGGASAHPLELGLHLHENVCADASDPPALARAICLSPFDAAIHDAAGIALNRSAFTFYEEDLPLPLADRHFQGKSACSAIRQILRPPVLESPAWLIVGYNDSLEEVAEKWMRGRGYYSFKLKLMGKDNAGDVERTAAVYRAAKVACSRPPRISVDANCATPDAASVLDYLERLHASDVEAYAAVEYVEQPTGRDIKTNRFDWHPVARLKPVVLDEGLTGFDTLEEAYEQGWSGISLKTCKGHSFALTAAAWAREHDMRLVLQDLTNPGIAAIHAMLFSAFVPTDNGVELNSPQYTPAANAEWLPRLRELFEPADGTHRLSTPVPPGLGSTL